MVGGSSFGQIGERRLSSWTEDKAVESPLMAQLLRRLVGLSVPGAPSGPRLDAAR